MTPAQLDQLTDGERRVLTPSELRVLRAYLANGTVKATAHALGVSESKLKRLMVVVRAKLGCETTAQVFYEAGRDGWLADPQVNAADLSHLR